MGNEAPREPRDGVPTIAIDLSRATNEIHRDLRQHWPRIGAMWWELEEGNRRGEVYDGRNRVIAKLVHEKKP